MPDTSATGSQPRMIVGRQRTVTAVAGDLLATCVLIALGIEREVRRSCESFYGSASAELPYRLPSGNRPVRAGA